MISPTIRSVIKDLTKKWKLVVFITFLAGVSSFLYFFYNPIQYSSTVRFLIDEEAIRKNDQNLNDQNIYLAENSPNGYRFYQMAKSTEMLDYLIKKFDLYKCYGIEVSKPMAYEIVCEIISDKISVSHMASSGMSITFEGSDKMLAAEIANAIFFKLEEMVKVYSISNMQRKIKIYEQILNNSTKEINLKSDELKKLIDEFKSLVSSNTRSGNIDLMYSMNMKLAGLSSQISSINGDLLKTIKNHEISLAISSQENLPNIQLISKALQDTRPPLLIMVIKKIILFMLFVFCLTIALIILYQQGKEAKKDVFYIGKSEKIRLEN